jgi:3-hydroxybutyryl-CoA dehydrogenase
MFSKVGVHTPIIPNSGEIASPSVGLRALALIQIRRELHVTEHGIKRVAIVGAGTMGAQIGSLIAINGHSVTITDALPEALTRAESRIDQQILPELAKAGIGSLSAAGGRANLAFAPDLERAISGADLVVEAVKEDVDVKTELFGRMDAINQEAILASNSSSIPSRNVVSKVSRSERVMNMHFFAPIWVRTMVEIMTCGRTDPSVLQRAQTFGQSLGLVAPIVRTESKGFIINRIWRAVKRESLRVVDEGVAEPEDIDRLWMIFFQTEYAPFGVMDMVGLDVVRDIEWSYQRETLDPTDKPSARLAEMIAQGKLGEKSGEGFYSHPNPAYSQPGFLPGRTIKKEK